MQCKFINTWFIFLTQDDVQSNMFQTGLLGITHRRGVAENSRVLGGTGAQSATRVDAEA